MISTEGREAFEARPKLQSLGESMGRIRLAVLAMACCFYFSVQIRCEEPLKVTVCQIQKDPPAFNHKLVEVESFVSHDFEDFTVFDPSCRTWPAIWLEYGGNSKSDTMYCCGPTSGKDRPQELTVENIPIPLIDNDEFRQFDKEIQPPFRSGKFGSIVHVTLVGRFFAGRKEQFGKGDPYWGGYGHMGCCSLLAIEEVRSVDPQSRNDLDYGASFDQPDMNKTGCGFDYLTPIEPGSAALDAQQQADRGRTSGAFEDPESVASRFLKIKLGLDPAIPLKLQERRKADGRIVYEWKWVRHPGSYMVVVSRPSWLSIYATNPNRVAWVVTAAYASSCGEGNQVERIR
jgi:hypothetical protein